MSPGKRSSGRGRPASGGPPRGSGPDGRIELSDLSDKLGELKGEVDDTTESVRPVLTYAAVGAAVVVVGLVFLLGRRAGRRKSTWVEIKRR